MTPGGVNVYFVMVLLPKAVVFRANFHVILAEASAMSAIKM